MRLTGLRHPAPHLTVELPHSDNSGPASQQEGGWHLLSGHKNEVQSSFLTRIFYTILSLRPRRWTQGLPKLPLPLPKASLAFPQSPLPTPWSRLSYDSARSPVSRVSVLDGEGALSTGQCRGSSPPQAHPPKGKGQDRAGGRADPIPVLPPTS